MKDPALHEILDTAVHQNGDGPLVDVEAAVRTGTQQLWQRLLITVALTALAVALITGTLIGVRLAQRSIVVVNSSSGTTGSQADTTTTTTTTATTTTTTRPTSSVGQPTLSAIQVDPPTEDLLVDQTVQLTVIGTYSDGHQEPVTDSVRWESANIKLATVDAAGLVTAVAVTESGASHVEITATVQGKSASAVVTTTKPRTLTGISISAPTSQDCIAGVSLSATGTYSDGSTQDITTRAQWSASSPEMQVENGRVTWAQQPPSPESTQAATSNQSRGIFALRSVAAPVSATLDDQTGTVNVTCATSIPVRKNDTSDVTPTPSTPPPTTPATTPPAPAVTPTTSP
jgi:Big-like domain-containing protein